MGRISMSMGSERRQNVSSPLNGLDRVFSSYVDEWKDKEEKRGGVVCESSLA